MFYKKELQKTNQNEFRVKRKAINYMLDGKVMIILLTVGLIKKDIINELIFSKTKMFRSKCEN